MASRSSKFHLAPLLDPFEAIVLTTDTPSSYSSIDDIPYDFRLHATPAPTC